MLEKLAKWYLSGYLRKHKYSNLEIVVRDDGWTIYRRNKEREESIKKTISRIK